MERISLLSAMAASSLYSWHVASLVACDSNAACLVWFASVEL